MGLKQALQEPPALGLPKSSKPFTLFVHERDNQAQEISHKNMVKSISLLPILVGGLIQ